MNMWKMVLVCSLFCASVAPFELQPLKWFDSTVSPSSIAIGDINHDGIPDIAVVYNSVYVYVVLNGTFNTGGTYYPGQNDDHELGFLLFSGKLDGSSPCRFQ
jgi:hypothetical protein